MNAIAQLKSPVEEFVDIVLDKERMDELAQSMPDHVRPALFKRNLLNAVMSNYDLLDFQPGLVFREVSKAAALGLLLDPQLQEAYLISCYNYKSHTKEPQLRPGWRGLVKLAKQSGEISQVYAHEVCEQDHIFCQMGVEKTLDHQPALFTDRGKIIGYYAVMKFRSGESDFEPMSVDEVHKIRDRSDAWKAFKEGKIKSTPWETDDSEMSKKTVIRRLLKRAPQSPELAEAIKLDDRDFELHRSAQIAHPRKAPAPPPETPAIEHKAAVAMDSIQPEPTAAAEVTTAPRRAPAPPPVDPEPPKPEPEIAWTDIIADYQDAAKAARDVDELDAAFGKHISPVENKMPKEMYEFACKIDDQCRGELE